MWLLCVLLFALVSQVGAQSIAVLVPRQEGVYQEFIDALRTESARQPALRLQVHELEAGPAALPAAAFDSALVITVGVSATRRYLAQPANPASPPVLAALVPRMTFEQLLDTYGSTKFRVTALYLDQSFSRQLDLMRHILPAARRIGIVLGPQSQREGDIFRSQSANRGLQVNVEYADRETELYAALQGAMLGIDALMLIPDPEVINAMTAQNVLLTALRRRVPVFAFSAAYVRAGALATVYSSPRQQGFEAAQIARQAIRSGVLPASRHPRQFSVVVNRNFAGQLGLDLPSDTSLAQRLGGGDHAP